MASSDEEGEIVPNCVSNYHLVDYKEEPISFSSLPLQWSEDEATDGMNTHLFLRGNENGGCQQIYKKVIAWKIELSYALPEIYVLSKDKTWIKLQRPRKSFECIIRTILITVHCLHFVKKNQKASGDELWKHLLKTFSSYEVGPSENDLLEHIRLIGEAAGRDEDIAKSEIQSFTLRKSNCLVLQENRTSKKSKFIVDVDEDYSGGGGGEDDDECDNNADELFDSVCALCDNGGNIICAHSTAEGQIMLESIEELGQAVQPESITGSAMSISKLTQELSQSGSFDSFRENPFVEAKSDVGDIAISKYFLRLSRVVAILKSQDAWRFCEGRCMRSFHTTKVAGAESFCESLGYTDAQVEVFPCVTATCGHFYHPTCVAKLLHPWDEIQAEVLQKKIAAGESFTCPAHKCFLCKQVEDKKVHDLQFAMCRRCPKAYHRKCLPRDHKIIPEIGTPRRDHVRFPEGNGKNKQYTSRLLPSKARMVAEKRSLVYGDLTERPAVKVQTKVDRMYAAAKGGDSTKRSEKEFSRAASEPQVYGVIRNSLKENITSVLTEVYKSSTVDKGKSSISSDQSHLLLSKRLNLIKSKQPNSLSCKTKNILVAKPQMKKASCQPLVDVEMEKRVATLMKNATSSFNLEEFIKKQKRPSTHGCSKFVVDKTITMGKVEGSVKAVRAALKKLEEGCTIEDAKAVCEPEILKQIIRWKTKLGVYLAPFLHGMRYTSFGRHFTKMDKLMERAS
ncbi:unnamed protein product [Ilex paraguariensis]|uniref:Uncharacterized protein n=1 Tax=Ilex paraguariensis TaxID=185542 RepID=A0ABC8QLA9_9AQUA